MPEWVLVVLIGLSLTPVAWIFVREFGLLKRGLPQAFTLVHDTPIGHGEPLNYGIEATREAFEVVEVDHYFHPDDIPSRAQVYRVDLLDEDGSPVHIYLVAPVEMAWLRGVRKKLLAAGYTSQESLALTRRADIEATRRYNEEMGATLPGGRASPRDESPPSGVHEVVLSEGGRVKTPGSSVDLSLSRGSVVKWYSEEGVDLTPSQDLEVDDAGVINCVAATRFLPPRAVKYYYDGEWKLSPDDVEIKNCKVVGPNDVGVGITPITDRLKQEVEDRLH